jgi:paraquat-inducible protein A
LLAGLALALGLLGGGVFLPTLSVETFPLIEDSVSVWQGLGVLWADGQVFLLVVLGLFSLVFPVAKLTLALWIAWRLDRPGPRLGRLVAVMDGLAKWSMLDVLVIAIVVAALNLTVIGGVTVHPGLYLFTASVVLSKLLIGRLAVRAGQVGVTRACPPPGSLVSFAPAEPARDPADPPA